MPAHLNLTQSSLVAVPITFFGPLISQTSWSPPQLTSNTILRDLLQPNNKPSVLFSHWNLLFGSFLNQLVDYLLSLISSSLCELTSNSSSPIDHLPSSTAHLSPLDASKQPVVFLLPSLPPSSLIHLLIRSSDFKHSLYHLPPSLPSPSPSPPRSPSLRTWWSSCFNKE